MLFVYKCFVLIYLYQVNAEEAKNNHTIKRPGKIYYNINEAQKLFNEFIINFDKDYDTAQYLYRFNIFKKSLHKINERNRRSSGSEVYGITQFSDETFDEFVHEHTGLNLTILLKNKKLASKLRLSNVTVPETWDWRKEGVVTPVKNQKKCESCWAFSAVGCIEGQYAKRHGLLMPFSEQQLVDCYKKSCRLGDLPHNAMNALSKMDGLLTDQDYPYRNALQTCQFKKTKAVVKIKNGIYYQALTEEELKRLVYTYGPVSLGIQANLGFLYYEGGIGTQMGLDCVSNNNINHAVLLVGYGIEKDEPYWIIKNSFGKRWGENGYMRLTRGKNTCNICVYAAIVRLV